MTKINFKKLLRNKKILVIILVLISLSTYLILKSTSSKNQQPTYTTAKAEKGTLINSVSGSGQIVAFDEIEIKPKISGEITYLNLKNGKKVNRGDLLVQLDSTEAQKNV
jgi:multidrug efflux pump subunit AcrA (membrane-fusion protein)